MLAQKVSLLSLKAIPSEILNLITDLSVLRNSNLSFVIPLFSLFHYNCSIQHKMPKSHKLALILPLLSLEFRLSSINLINCQKLVTVVVALYAFCDEYPTAWIYVTGSTRARTRLYRMGINKYYETVVQDFELFGQAESEWKRYQKGRDCQAFVVQRKNRNLKP